MEVEDLSFGGRDLLHGDESDFGSSRFVELSCSRRGGREAFVSQWMWLVYDVRVAGFLFCFLILLDEGDRRRGR